MPDEDNEILKYIPGEKSLKVLFTIYADLECLLRKINICQNNPEKSYTEKKAMHRPSGYSSVACYSFDKLKRKIKYYRGEDLTKKKRHMKIRNFVIYVNKNFVRMKIIKKNLN